MNKIISYLAIVVLSVAGFSAAAKEASNAQQNTLANLDTKAVELAASIEKVQKQLSELDAQKNERMKVEIERDRKGIEFWFSLLGVLVGALTLIFGLIPVIFIYFQSKRTEKELEEAKELVRLIKKEHSVALSDAAEIKKLKDFNSQKVTTAEDKLEIAKEVKAVTDNPNASQIDKLRARAVEASQHEKPTLEQAEFAFDLWKAIAVENPQDVKALFNAAYWAGITADLSEAENKIYWLHQAQKLNEQTFRINPKKHGVAYNWGVALYREAIEIAKIDLKTALALWRLAGEKYALALSIKADKHEAASNWGNTLGSEATELAKTDLKAAQTLWLQAGEKYALALSIKADKHEAAYNWGNALDREATELAKTDLKAAQTLWLQAGEKYALALNIKADKYEAAYNWGNALERESTELAKTDLKAAQILWQQAGEKYALALKLNPSEKCKIAYDGWKNKHLGDDKT